VCDDVLYTKLLRTNVYFFFFFFIVQHTPTHAHARLTRTRARTHINREPWVVPENMLNPDSKARGPDWLV